MKHSKILNLFWKKKKKQDFFTQFSFEFKQIVKDMILPYRNFFHWLISKIIINIVAFLIWVTLALPFVVLWVFLALIDPIPWWDFIVYQVRGFDPLPEVLSYASMFIFPFVIMTLLMIWAFIAFIIWNAYSNVLFVPLYRSYMNWEKLGFSKNLQVEFVRIRYFTKIAFIQLSILILPVIIAWIFVLILVNQWRQEIIGFEAFSLLVLPILLILIFIISYILFRILFSVIIFADTSSKSIQKHSAMHFIKKSLKLTRGFGNYIKFLFVLFTIYILTYPLTAITDRVVEDRDRLAQTIEYRALYVDDSELALNSRIREIALDYENLNDQELRANFRWAQILALLFWIIWFMLFSWIYTMMFVSFYTRVLK